MIKPAIRLATLALFFGALAASPAAVPAFAAGGGDPGAADLTRPGAAAPPSDTRSSARPTVRTPQRTKKAAKQSFLNDPAFIRGYHEAYVSIYDRHDYASALEQLKALGHDDYEYRTLAAALEQPPGSGLIY